MSSLSELSRDARGRYRLWDGKYPEGAWAELTDPLSFFVGSIIIASGEPNPEAKSFRVGATLFVGLYAAAAAFIGLVFPAFDLGDPLVYAATLFVAGALTLLPGRLAELRNRGVAAGNGYPRRLRTVMWRIEVVILRAAVPILLVVGLTGALSHSWFRAVVWALLAVSYLDLYTASACAVIHIRREHLAEKMQRQA